MPVLPCPTAPTHELPGARFTTLATPSLGTCETAVWTVEVLPGAVAGPPRDVERERPRARRLDQRVRDPRRLPGQSPE